MFFTLVTDGSVTLTSQGVYRTADVYVRGRFIFAKFGTGYIRLSAYDSSTSAPRVKYEDLALPFVPVKDNCFRLMTPEDWKPE